jgi:hypothetical protein
MPSSLVRAIRGVGCRSHMSPVRAQSATTLRPQVVSVSDFVMTTGYDENAPAACQDRDGDLIPPTLARRAGRPVSNASQEKHQSPADTQDVPNWGHTPWCNLEQHALTEENAGRPYGCVGSAIDAPGTIMGANPGGWWVQKTPGGEARFVLDWNLRFDEFSVEDVPTLHGLLLNLGPAEIATALALTTAALVEYGEDPADADGEL